MFVEVETISFVKEAALRQVRPRIAALILLSICSSRLPALGFGVDYCTLGAGVFPNVLRDILDSCRGCDVVWCDVMTWHGMRWEVR